MSLAIFFSCVPSVVLILLVKVQSRVFAAECSKPQTDISNAKDQRSDGVMFIDIYNYEFKNLSVSRLKKTKIGISTVGVKNDYD